MSSGRAPPRGEGYKEHATFARREKSDASFAGAGIDLLAIDTFIGDSSEMPDNKCSNCILFKTQCTHLYISKDSNSSSLNYKNSREHVAAILSQTAVYVPSSDPAVLFQTLVGIAKYARNLEELLAVSSSTSLDLSSSPFADPEDGISVDASQKNEVSDDDDGVFVDLDVIEPMSRLALRAPNSELHEKHKFFGKSSSMNFVKAAMEGTNLGESHTFDTQRPEFWIVQPWHPAPEPPPPLCFPDEDFLQSLIDIYFRHINQIIFLLHPPTFRASVADGEHLRDIHFGAVLLAVCGLASRLSDDPRVLMADDAPLHSAGWKFFSQTRPLQLVTFPHASSDSQFRTLYDLQLICLSAFFVSTSNVRASWLLSGLGIRLAQDKGAHRRSRYSAGPRSYGELLKRAFWCLFTMDTMLNSVLGRPTATTSEDYDVDLPIECDDEYWDEPHRFQQPPEKPSLAAYMTSYLTLMSILNRVQRSIVEADFFFQSYGVSRQKEREPEIVAELDSALNKWVDSIPRHLRWSSNVEGVCLDQSVSLYMTYYHGSFSVACHSETPPTADASFPSLAIAANAARSCGHIMEEHSRRTGDVLHHPHALTALSDSALLLLLNVWGSRQQRSSSDIIRAVADIKKCVDVLHLYEKRDMITEMLNRACGDTLGTLPQRSLKRRVPDDAEDSGSQATPAVRQLEDLELSIRQTDHLFSLPLYTQELGLLPIYESFDFQFSFDPHQLSSSSSSNSDSALGFMPLDGLEQPEYIPLNEDLQQPAVTYSWEDWSNFVDHDHSH
ncbi:Zn(2)-C6 fungal-type domain-containing protein [Mycena venus]|uniref:Zn(2)-C6 fungal-type domain-containing protein n=1 Tax=Mycena venus TaxID=2733690 RepID=A0A8H7CR80_9AGAR|nr:Zn(2)-C6 fungal-type domain-containing protein [Mycena venus]